MAATWLLFVVTCSAAETTRPNIVLILADDLGYGDLSAYGAKDIRTPHIDLLAQQGIRFTDHYTPANTCSPSRAALLTGRYPPRTGVNAVISYDSLEGLPLAEVTLAEVLREAGYQTLMIGKWHLGQVEALMPWHQGFDRFFGVATSNDDYNFYLYESEGTKYQRLPEAIDQAQLTQRYTEKALQFLESQRGSGQPFFLYMAHNIPHIPLHPHPRFVGSSSRGTYGDAVQELDDSVGQVLSKLQSLGMDSNTLVIFTSDNGAWRTMRDQGGSNAPLREGKLTAFEGGHRVPALVRWPGHVAAGQVNREVVTNMDWFVTLVEYAHGNLPADRMIDGRSLQGLLAGSSQRQREPFFYFALRPPHEEQTYRLAGVRLGQWKLKLAQDGYYPQLVEPLMGVGLYRHGDLLFDLGKDPGETNNLVDEYPEVADSLRELAQDFEKNNPMPAPINVNAADKDDAGWEQLWYGIGITAVLFAAGLLALCYFLLKCWRHFRN